MLNGNPATIRRFAHDSILGQWCIETRVPRPQLAEVIEMLWYGEGRVNYLRDRILPSGGAYLLVNLGPTQYRIDPGPPSDKDLYDLPPEEEKNIPTVCHSLDQALEALDADRDFLKVGGVFSDDFIDGYIALKMGEVTKFRAATHPLEYAMYYQL